MMQIGAEAMDWQPIETAPKDGSLILGYDTRLSDDKQHARYYHGAWKDSDGEVYRGSIYEVVCWIESERWVSIHMGGDNYRRTRRDNSHWARSQGSWQPTHWMPLPQPPSEK